MDFSPWAVVNRFLPCKFLARRASRGKECCSLAVCTWGTKQSFCLSPAWHCLVSLDVPQGLYWKKQPKLLPMHSPSGIQEFQHLCHILSITPFSDREPQSIRYGFILGVSFVTSRLFLFLAYFFWEAKAKLGNSHGSVLLSFPYNFLRCFDLLPS